MAHSQHLSAAQAAYIRRRLRRANIHPTRTGAPARGSSSFPPAGPATGSVPPALPVATHTHPLILIFGAIACAAIWGLILVCALLAPLGVLP